MKGREIYERGWIKNGRGSLAAGTVKELSSYSWPRRELYVRQKLNKKYKSAHIQYTGNSTSCMNTQHESQTCSALLHLLHLALWAPPQQYLPRTSTRFITNVASTCWMFLSRSHVMTLCETPTTCHFLNRSFVQAARHAVCYIYCVFRAHPRVPGSYPTFSATYCCADKHSCSANFLWRFQFVTHVCMTPLAITLHNRPRKRL